MQFTNPTGEAFELTLVGYEFPHIVNERYDANWLQVSFTATQAGRTWSALEPCMLTWEVERLAHWFKALGAGQPTEPECCFIEPVLAFRLHPEAAGAIIRVAFALEGRPPWADREAGVWIDFPTQAIDLAQVGQSLEMQLQRYPQRVVRAAPKN